MKKMSSLVLCLLAILMLNGCGKTNAEQTVDEGSVSDQTQVEEQAETSQTETKEVVEAKGEEETETPTEKVSEMEEVVFERAIEVDQEIIDLGGLTYLTFYMGASIEDVVHDFGEPTGSEAKAPVLIYEDFNFLIDFDTNLVTGFTTYTSEFLNLSIGMSEDEVIAIMGEPHDITGDLELPLYWYYDGDRYIIVGFENDSAISIGYSINFNRDEPVENQQEYVLRTDEGLILHNMDIVQKEHMFFISGIVENDSTIPLKSVDIQFGIYDVDNNIITTTSDYISLIEVGGTWKYECYINTDEGASFNIMHLKTLY